MNLPRDRRQGSLWLLVTVVLALLTSILVAGMPSFSGASFVSKSKATATVAAAADWTPPTVAMRAPAAVVQGVTGVTADATDAETGIHDVVIQAEVDGGDWVTVCTKTTAPYTCSWDTATQPDGDYDLRAIATDNAGYTTTSDLVTTIVANKLRVVLKDSDDLVWGTVPLTETLYAAGSLSYAMKIQYSVAGANTWTDICKPAAAPYTAPLTCQWATPNSGYYDLRAIATTGGITTSSDVITDVLVDNTAPASVSLALAPGTPAPLRGVVQFDTVPDDVHSGVAQVTVQYSLAGKNTWVDFCTVTEDPWSCDGDTTVMTDLQKYDFRAVATDFAGNTKISAGVNGKAVDNSNPSVSLSNPGQILMGTITLDAAASSYAGVNSVRIQWSPAGAGTWTDVCADTSKPYSCAWDTTAKKADGSALVPDGLYDLRAVMAHGTGLTLVSNVVTSRLVDNNPVRAVDVQAFQGGGKRGQIWSGDTMTFLYSSEMNLSTISAGWTGTTPLPVTLRLRDGLLLDPVGGKLDHHNDGLDVLVGGTPINLGSVRLADDHIGDRKTATFNATLTRSFTTYNGYRATLLTLTIGTKILGDIPKAPNHNKSLVWTPSGLATDLLGQKVSATPAKESGMLDVDF